MIYHIYCLKDPDTDQVFYVGKTCNPKERLAGHIGNAAGGLPENKKKAAWIARLSQEGKKPVMELLDTAAESDWPEKEEQWIRTMRARGEPLVNRWRLPRMAPEAAKAIRVSLGMTQEDMAEYLCLKHKSQVAHLESGRTPVQGPVCRLLELLRDTEGKIFQNIQNRG